MQKKKQILILKPNTSIAIHYSTVLSKLRKYFGYVRTISICSYCKRRLVSKSSTNICPNCNHTTADSIHKYSYKGLGHADLEHAFFAKSQNVSEFFSSDRSFKDLNKDITFKNMRFTIING